MDLKLTTKSQEALSDAIRRAVAAGHPQVEPAHVLLALLDQADGTAAPLLEAVGTDKGAVRARAQALVDRLPAATGSSVSAPQTSRPTLEALNAAGDAARELGDDYVSTEHLLVGLAQAGGPVADLLRDGGATPDALRAAFPPYGAPRG